MARGFCKYSREKRPPKFGGEKLCCVFSGQLGFFSSDAMNKIKIFATCSSNDVDIAFTDSISQIGRDTIFVKKFTNFCPSEVPK